MARVLLVSANTCSEPYAVFPLGLGVLQRALARNGHAAYIFDPLAQNSGGSSLREVIRDWEPEFIAVSLRNIDNVDSYSCTDNWYVQKARDLTAEAQENGCPVIIGGPGFSLLAEEILEYTGADHGVIGEGEKSLPWLVSKLSRGEHCPRLISSFELFGRIPGPEISGADIDEHLAGHYLQASGILNLQSKRGCNFCCAYCPYPALEPGGPRKRGVKEVAGEMAEMQARFRPELFFFVDSVFNDPGGHHLELAEEILRQGIEVSWSAFFHPAETGIEELKLLQRAGLKCIELGTDASTDQTLQGLNKSFGMDTVFSFQEKCTRLKLPCAHFVIFGGPGEDMDTVREGIDNLNRLDKCVVFPFSGIRILKHTPLHDRAVHEGLLDPETPLLRPIFYFSPGIDPQAMNRELEKGFAGRGDRIFPPAQSADRIKVMRGFGYKGVLWDRLIRF
ncbi:MAG: lipid biosynthesis B12-binding/radical SAM protein [Desulfonatronovibrionaceae bacterium]